MFVVGLYIVREYEGNYLLSLHESTASAKQAIVERDRKMKIDELYSQSFNRMYNVYHKMHPAPDREAVMALKPKYDHAAAASKEYNKMHNARVEEWKQTHYNALTELERQHQLKYREFMNGWEAENPKESMDFTEQELASIEVTDKYKTEILEVLK